MTITTTQKLGISIATLGFMAGSATQLTDIFSPFGSAAPVIVKEIVSLSGFASGVLGIILSFLSGQQSQIKAVVDMAKASNSPVQGVITSATSEGKMLAASIAGPIVTAGSAAATELSKP
jgi:hypothetical protein